MNNFIFSILMSYASIIGIVGLLSFALFIFALIAKSKLFKKFGVSGAKAFIPIISDIALFNDVSQIGIGWFILSLFIPFTKVANSFAIYNLVGASNISEKANTYAILSLLLPTNIIYIMLGFNKNYKPLFEDGSSENSEFEDNEF